MQHPHDFFLPVKLCKTAADPVEYPFTHGFQGNQYNIFGLGAADMAWAIINNRPPRCSGEFALHMVELVHGIMESTKTHLPYNMTTTMEKPAPLPEGYIGNGAWAPGEENALVF